jgi:cytochrome P450
MINTGGAVDKADIPEHVPPDLVYAFDYINDEDLKTDPHARLAQVQGEAPPIFYTPCNGGHWIAQGCQELREMLRNTDSFSSTEIAIPGMKGEPRRIPLNIDPPDHTKYRRVLNLAFAPKAIMSLEPEIRERTAELISLVLDKGGCEFLEAIAEPLPVLLFLQLAGMPTERMKDFRSWVTTLFREAASAEKRAEVSASILQAMTETIKKRIAKRESDIVSRLIDSEIDGREPTLEELQGYCVLLLIGGVDTVVNILSYGVRHLAQDLPLQRYLREHPERVADLVEEILRVYAITNPGRIVMKDTTYGGITFRKGDRVLMMMSGAGLDKRMYLDPAKVDLDRQDKAHVSFGGGPHRCAGSHLARLELRVFFDTFLKMMPEFRLDPDRPAKFHGGPAVHVNELNLLWN